jgi:hypothetical protein
MFLSKRYIEIMIAFGKKTLYHDIDIFAIIGKRIAIIIVIIIEAIKCYSVCKERMRIRVWNIRRDMKNG